MAKNVTSEKITLKNVRLSFPSLERPRAFKEGQEAKFEASFLLDPSSKEHAVIIKQIKDESARVAKVQFDGEIPKSLEKCWGNGNDLDKVYEGYADMFWVKAKSATRVPVVGRRKNADGKFPPLGAGDAEWPFAGCYVNATVTVWAQNSHGRKAINGNLLAVQFVKGGDAFSGNKTAVPEEDFEGLEDGAEADPFAT
jgi:hypothetical protein